MIRTRIETIDKDKAIEYLKCNMVNRDISRGRVLQYADSMKRGDWQLNGDSIKFNERGEMVDGQHRLSAIIETGIPITTVVMTGIEDGICLFDRGRNRSTTDSLLIEGFSRKLANNTCVAIAKLNYSLQGKQENVSDSYIREFLIENEADLVKIVEIISRGSSHHAGSGKTLARNAPMGLAIYYAVNTEVEWSEIEEFVQIVKSGFYENRKQTAAIVLRNDILNGCLTAHGKEKRKSSVYAMERAIYDYHHGVERKRSYRQTDTPTYSNNKRFQKGIKA